MGTIKIELPIQAEDDFKIESKETGKKFLREFEVFIKKFKSETSEKKINEKMKPGKNLQAAHDYLELLEGSEESAEATRVAAEMRKDWMRKYD